MQQRDVHRSRRTVVSENHRRLHVASTTRPSVTPYPSALIKPCGRAVRERLATVECARVFVRQLSRDKSRLVGCEHGRVWRARFASNEQKRKEDDLCFHIYLTPFHPFFLEAMADFPRLRRFVLTTALFVTRPQHPGNSIDWRPRPAGPSAVLAQRQPTARPAHGMGTNRGSTRHESVDGFMRPRH